MTARASLSDITGATVVRFESADGCSFNVNDAEAQRRIAYGDTKFRVLPGDVSGDQVEAYLYAILRLDRHRFVFDLPASMRSNGAVSGGHREGFVFQRGADGRADGRPVGKVIFLTYDRKFRERDPSDRADFERME